MSDLNAFLYRADNASGGEGPLAGLRVGVKANIAVKGMPFHAGIGAWASRVAERDAQVVTALRTAGAAITGILNMEEAALGSKTDNPHFGPTQNPHCDGYSPGGSSGGSGAAVAAHQCDVALGTDTMGSVRIPAAHCGVYGFKPATDRVSQQGLIAADPALDAIGPLARNLTTLQRVARVISDFGEGDLGGSGAVLIDHGVELHPRVAECWRTAQHALGGELAETNLTHPNSRIRFAGFIQVTRELSWQLERTIVSDRLRSLLKYGPKRSADDWSEDQQVLATTRDEVRSIVAEHGFLLLPTVPNPPFPHSEPEPAAQADFTCLANMAGLPAISIPAGWTEDDLPIGVQIIGQAGAEAGLFDLARRLDATLGAYRSPN